MSPRRVLHLLAFLVPLAVFTYLLLVPVPPTPKVEEEWVSFVINKTAHAGGFTYLTLVGYCYPRGVGNRWKPVLFLMLYAIGTEIGQRYTGRHGCVQDVLIDWAGIAVGTFLARRVARPRGAENSAPPAFAGSHFPAARPE